MVTPWLRMLEGLHPSSSTPNKKQHVLLAVVGTALSPVLGRLRQEDREFEASLGNTTLYSCLKKMNKKLETETEKHGLTWLGPGQQRVLLIPPECLGMNMWREIWSLTWQTDGDKSGTIHLVPTRAECSHLKGPHQYVCHVSASSLDFIVYTRGSLGVAGTTVGLA